ncbi:hypothetical protein HDV01_007677 [Terramyces sp. JEL0728]|nr:hypothetical protein HDV01_000435 [Terramyces sp. JEL0728]KAJ3275674.1 hypothetical protein HDV01_007677 [Terramyces sp. JEL0728]
MVTNHENYVISAPGKVILFGEHAVVYNQKCIATSLDKRTFCEAKLSQHIILNCPDISLYYNSTIQTESNNALLAFLKMAELTEIDGCEITIRSEIPVGAGLGSSASFCVCIAAGLLLLKGDISLDFKEKDLKMINELAFEGERVLHGSPSGVDNTIATYGGAKIYQKNCPLEDLKGFKELDILLTDSRVEKNTKRQVEMFGQRNRNFPDIMGHVIHAIGSISESCAELFSNTSKAEQIYSDLAVLVNMNQQLLVCAGMSHPVIDTLCATSARYGLTTKLTGAGGGGCCLTLIDKDASQEKINGLLNAFTNLQVDSFYTKVGVTGVQAIKSDCAVKITEAEFADLRNLFLK